MDGADCTDGNRRCVFVVPGGCKTARKVFFCRSFLSGYKAYESVNNKAFLHPFTGWRYAFLHFRRLLT